MRTQSNGTAQQRDLRRVYAPEVRQLTGWSDNWLRAMIRRGQWPAPRVDAGGNRRWWLNEAVDSALSLLDATSPVSVSAPVEGKLEGRGVTGHAKKARAR